MKTILAAVLAVAFLASTPVFAGVTADKDDSAGKAGASGKKSKGDKSGKKDDKKDEGAAKPSGGW